ncbi:hypothetical protein PMLGA01_090020900, partial [Plasmodium malariae]
ENEQRRNYYIIPNKYIRNNDVCVNSEKDVQSNATKEGTINVNIDYEFRRESNSFIKTSEEYACRYAGATGEYCEGVTKQDATNECKRDITIEGKNQMGVGKKQQVGEVRHHSEGRPSYSSNTLREKYINLKVKKKNDISFLFNDSSDNIMNHVDGIRNNNTESFFVFSKNEDNIRETVDRSIEKEQTKEYTYETKCLNVYNMEDSGISSSLCNALRT